MSVAALWSCDLARRHRLMSLADYPLVSHLHRHVFPDRDILFLNPWLKLLLSRICWLLLGTARCRCGRCASFVVEEVGSHCYLGYLKYEELEGEIDLKSVIGVCELLANLR